MNITKEILIGLIEFYNKDRALERIVKRHLITMFTVEEIQKLNSSFYALNTNLNGSIELNELQEGLKFIRAFISNIELEKAINLAGGKICYSDFLASNVNLKKFNSKSFINEVFKYFDYDQNGYIDEKDLDNYYSRKGKKVNDIATLKNVITEVCESLDLADKTKINLENNLNYFFHSFHSFLFFFLFYQFFS